MSKELMIQSLSTWATEQNLVERVSHVQKIMGAVMRKDEHYGVIQGCKKPSLYKAGAEILCMTFGLFPRFDFKIEHLQNGHREVISTCTLYNASGAIVGSGTGSCSTMESKYRWRNAERVCPSCGKSTIIKGKEEYGGGFICFVKKGGCGEKFENSAPSIVNQVVGKVENEDIADQWNTILKMSQKRSFVGTTLVATATSDMFTQDVEDLPQYAVQEKKQATQSTTAQEPPNETTQQATLRIAKSDPYNLSDELITDKLGTQDWINASPSGYKALQSEIKRLKALHDNKAEEA